MLSEPIPNVFWTYSEHITNTFLACPGPEDSNCLVWEAFTDDDVDEGANEDNPVAISDDPESSSLSELDEDEVETDVDMDADGTAG